MPQRIAFYIVFALFFTVFALFSALPGFAQTGAINGSTSLLTPNGKPMTMQQASLTFQAPPRQRVFQVEDIIYVTVKDKILYTNTANNQRKKKIETIAELTAWSKVSGLFKMPVAASGGALPEVGGKIDHKTQNQGRLTREETLNLTIACRITDVRDNGNLVIEGNRSTSIGEEGRIITVTGMVRPDKIGPDYKVDSSEIVDFALQDVPSGNVYDTVRRPWGTQFVERFKPF
jgi:flagellar basal body L-ring protein FlgH